MSQTPAELTNETISTEYMSTREILLRLWRLKFFFLIPLVLCLLLGAFWVSASIAQNDESTYSYKIKFNFSGVSDGKYPNGEAFHFADILAPNIVNTVYNNHIAGQFKVSGQQFKSAFTVSSFAPGQDFIIKKFQALLANKRITVTDATKAQIDLADQLRQTRRLSAVISFQNTGLDLPKGVVSTVLEKVVEEWNRFTTEQRGVLEINVKGIEPNFLNADNLVGASEINRLHSLIAMFQKVQSYLEGISRFEVAQSLRDPETGATFTSLSSELSAIEGKIIDLSRSWVIYSDKQRPLLPGLLSSSAFGNEAINGLDAQIAYDLLLERVTDIRTNIAKLNALDATAIKDPSTNISISDLQNILNEMETFQIRPLRDAVLQSGKSDKPDSVRAYYQQRIRELELQRRRLIALAGVVDRVDQRYENNASGNISATTDSSTSQATRSTTVIPQFDDGFLDRLIQMSSKEDETKFRQELARKSIELLESVANIDSQIAGLKSDLAIFEAGLQNTPTNSGSANTIQADQQLRTLLSQLKNHLDVTVRIGQRLAAAEQMKSVFVTNLKLDENDSRLSRRAFLRNDDLNKMQLSDVITPLKKVVEAANRIAKEISVELYGSKSLAESFSNPSPVKHL